MDFTKFKMVNRYDRIQAVSDDEFSRRQALARRLMEDNGLGALLVVRPYSAGAGMWLAGDRQADYIAVFPTGDISAVYESGFGVGGVDRYARFRYVEDSFRPEIRVRDSLDIAALARACKGKALGVIHLEQLTIGLKRRLEGIELVDITLEFDKLQGRKSEFEAELIRESGRLNQKVLEALPAIIREGRLYKEICDELQYLAASLGCSGEHMISMLHVFDNGGNSRTPLKDARPGVRAKRGDQIAYLLECSGPGGYFTVSGRVFSLGEPTEEFRRKYEIAVEANRMAGRLLKEGATLRAVADEVNEFIRSTGYKTDNCCYMHALGYDSCTRPKLGDYSHAPEPDESENEPLCVLHDSLAHPHVNFKEKFTSRSEAVRCIDTYFVGKTEGERVNTLKQDIFII